ncbi:hypothetical protein ACFX1R_006656 [Malus domestica]
MGHRSELMMLKATLIKDPCVSVKRILWSPWYSIWSCISNYTLILVGMRFTSIWRLMLMLVVLMIWRSATRLCNFVPYLAVMMLPCILCALITRKMSIFSFQHQ